MLPNVAWGLQEGDAGAWSWSCREQGATRQVGWPSPLVKVMWLVRREGMRKIRKVKTSLSRRCRTQPLSQFGTSRTGGVFSLSEVQQCWSDVMNSLEAQGKVMRDLEDGWADFRQTLPGPASRGASARRSEAPRRLDLDGRGRLRHSTSLSKSGHVWTPGDERQVSATRRWACWGLGYGCSIVASYRRADNVDKGGAGFDEAECHHSGDAYGSEAGWVVPPWGAFIRASRRISVGGSGTNFHCQPFLGAGRAWTRSRCWAFPSAHPEKLLFDSLALQASASSRVGTWAAGLLVWIPPSLCWAQPGGRTWEAQQELEAERISIVAQLVSASISSILLGFIRPKNGLGFPPAVGLDAALQPASSLARETLEAEIDRASRIHYLNLSAGVTQRHLCLHCQLCLVAPRRSTARVAWMAAGGPRCKTSWRHLSHIITRSRSCTVSWSWRARRRRRTWVAARGWLACRILPSSGQACSRAKKDTWHALKWVPLLRENEFEKRVEHLFDLYLSPAVSGQTQGQRSLQGRCPGRWLLGSLCKQRAFLTSAQFECRAEG